MASFKTVEYDAVKYEGISVQVPVPDFPYKTYSTTGRYFRLLTLISEAQDDSLIECEMDHYSLDELPPYTALSYQWGDPSRFKWILVNSMESR